ncbi:MAG: tRNA (N6-isopentenyl adenosine(37)-C2)-methylthiotransferase MiaB [Spirochaetales bacterium]|nr:tRNA (N6-isopentenyl adenosine(37)-C2)-methylthiotransferase MiaB [Spirochaetales bacterium]
MKFYIVVLGCQMNLSDGERLKSVLKDMGMTEADREEDANLLGMVACSVRQKAIDKVHTRIHLWKKWQKEKKVMTFLTGCVLPEDKKKFVKDFDLVFDIKDAGTLPELISGHGEVSPATVNTRELWHVDPDYASRFEAFIPIQNGCNNFCTYCAVPYTRGREESRPSAEIEEEFSALVEKGYKAITLLGQNVNSYGSERRKEEITFPELMDRLATKADEAEESPWIYFTAPHPKDMSDELIEVMARHKSAAKQIHLPIQSGDDKILKEMNRRYTVDHYRQIVTKVRKAMPEATLFTDIIVGFPGETEEQFENTARMMEEFQFNMAFIAMYSPRPGAKSTEWQDDIPQEVKKDRFHRLSEIMQKSAVAWNEALVGQEVTALVSGRSRKGDKYAGRTEGMISIQFESEREDLIGQFVKLKVTGVHGISLSGEIIES